MECKLYVDVLMLNPEFDIGLKLGLGPGLCTCTMNADVRIWTEDKTKTLCIVQNVFVMRYFQKMEIVLQYQLTSTRLSYVFDK